MYIEILVIFQYSKIESPSLQIEFLGLPISRKHIEKFLSDLFNKRHLIAPGRDAVYIRCHKFNFCALFVCPSALIKKVPSLHAAARCKCPFLGNFTMPFFEAGGNTNL